MMARNERRWRAIKIGLVGPRLKGGRAEPSEPRIQCGVRSRCIGRVIGPGYAPKSKATVVVINAIVPS